MNDITALAQRMKAAAEKASNGEWVKESGDGWEATCSANDQANGGFIIAHFEGPDAAANREFVQAAHPANVLALVEALEARDKSIVFLKEQLEQLANFNPDWDRLEAATDSLREHMAELNFAQARIAELERMESALRPVGVMSQAAYHRLENRESRFIALWPRPEIYLPRKRPDDGVIVYARTAGIQVIEGEGQ
ncbi:ead/Ea22-like family protein [Escherichia coli]|uniref:ead/Ea22-like family protein n=1 Tax=Escherichia coli TaxID=562 RepID=UPI0022443E9A|nr:ead/Ea22-like family protein [Escherichia coli]MCW8046148.1 ead/Ea22-like family protein [Escherichia coli]